MVMCEFGKAYFFQHEPGGKFVNRDFLYHVVGLNVVNHFPHSEEFLFGSAACVMALDAESAAEIFFEENGIYTLCLVVPLYAGTFIDNVEFMEVMSNGNY